MGRWLAAVSWLGLLTLACLDAPPSSAPGLDSAAALDAPPAPSCDDQFGQTSDYLLCEERPETCRFVASGNDESCAQICTRFDSTCDTGFDASGIDDCTAEIEDGCDEPHDTMICVCTR